jgi:hypothetical protein
MKTKKVKDLSEDDSFIIRYNDKIIKIIIKEISRNALLLSNKDDNSLFRVTRDEFETIEIIETTYQKYRDGYREDSKFIAKIIDDIYYEWHKRSNSASEYVSNPKLYVGIDLYNKIEEVFHVSNANFTISMVTGVLMLICKNYYIEIFVDENITNDGISYNLKYN